MRHHKFTIGGLLWFLLALMWRRISTTVPSSICAPPGETCSARLPKKAGPEAVCHPGGCDRYSRQNGGHRHLSLLYDPAGRGIKIGPFRALSLFKEATPEKASFFVAAGQGFSAGWSALLTPVFVMRRSVKSELPVPAVFADCVDPEHVGTGSYTDGRIPGGKNQRIRFS